MFGRKRKKDEENVGLAGLGTGGVSPSFESTPTVSVSARPLSPQTTAIPASPEPTPPLETPPAPAPAETPPSADAPFGIPGLAAGMTQTNPAALLGQILSGHGPVGELVAQIRADPEAFRQRMIAQVEAAGGSAAMIPPQWDANLAAGALPTGVPPSQPQAQPLDVIDELTKAADLHHKGVLNDAEFEAYKKKLLGE